MKADLDTATEFLHGLFEKVWEEDKLSDDWKKGLIMKLPTKGDPRDCKNYRGIMLLSVHGKVLDRILLERMKTAADSKLCDNQAGFRQSRSCTDHIATLRISIEQSLEWNSFALCQLYCYEKAFDSIHRETLWEL